LLEAGAFEALDFGFFEICSAECSLSAYCWASTSYFLAEVLDYLPPLYPCLLSVAYVYSGSSWILTALFGADYLPRRALASATGSASSSCCSGSSSAYSILMAYDFLVEARVIFFFGGLGMS
jgi:hypothetical protein